MIAVKRMGRLAAVLLAVMASAAAGVVVGGQTKEPDYPKMIVANKAADRVPVLAEVTSLPAVQVSSGLIDLGIDSIAALKDGAVVRIAPPEWEYRELKAPTSPGVYRSMLRELTEAGADGWETTGLMFSDTDSTVVILKRPRLPQAGAPSDR